MRPDWPSRPIPADVAEAPPLAPKQSCVDYSDRRAEPRHETEEELWLAFDEPVRQQIACTLVDYSHSGFRAIHHCSDLRTGQLVQFRYSRASGLARVIWNRILPDRVESGFFVFPNV